MNLIPILILVLIIFLIAVLLFRTALFGIDPMEVEALPEEDVDIDANTVASHLSLAVAIPTISSEDPKTFDLKPFDQLHDLFETVYPTVHAHLRREIINGGSLLFTWQGTDPDLDPILLMSHLDVVPVDSASRAEWEYPPFKGEIADGYVWGRGTLDIKSGVVAILEAVETLLKQGYTPQRTILLAFGHDEEVGGQLGTAGIVEVLQKRGVVLEAVLDEGGGVVDGILPGVEPPVALLGNAEKGHVTFELVVDSSGGHSATPPQQTAIGILSAAITQLESHPFPANPRIIQPMFEALGDDCPILTRLVFANLWLLGGLAKKQLLALPKTAAAIRTTTAPTYIEGGVKDNILPRKARALVNMRILPGETVETVTERVKKIIHDERVDVHITNDHSAWEPSPVSAPDSPRYLWIERTIRQIFPEAAVVPNLVLGATDSRHYVSLTSNIFRFTPYLLDENEMDRGHGVNERMSVENLGKMVRFFIQLLHSVDEEVEEA
jgi:carboxypeptidase PM20D1